MLRKGYYSPKRRAIMLKGDPIVHVEIFERDGWICGICHKTIDRWRRGSDWMRATLDHIIPISLGGLHTFDNVQAAHYRCNQLKGNQLTLGDPDDIMVV